MLSEIPDFEALRKVKMKSREDFIELQKVEQSETVVVKRRYWWLR